MNWPSVRSLSAALLFCAFLAAATSCQDSDRTSAGPDSRRVDSGKEVVVAAMGDWEGTNRPGWRGLELAAGEINQSGGIGGKPIRLWRNDVADDPHQGIQQAQVIANNPKTAMTILASRRKVAVPAATVLAYYGVLTMLTRVTAPMDAINLPLLFRMSPTDADEMNYLARFCVHVGIKRAALFVFNSDFARIRANTFEIEAKTKGIELAPRVECDMLTREEEFTRELAALKKNHPFDAIFFCGPPDLAEKLMKAAADLKMEQPFLGGSQWDTPGLARVAASAKISAYLVTQFSPERKDNAAQRFVAAYRQAYGEPPDDQAAIAYSSLRLYAQAANRAGSVNPGRVAFDLTNTERWDGPFGEMRFNKSGELKATALYINHFEHGVAQTIDFERKNGGS